MSTNQSHVHVTPVVIEKLPHGRATPPPTQRELVKASLLARPYPDSTKPAA